MLPLPEAAQARLPPLEKRQEKKLALPTQPEQQGPLPLAQLAELPV